MKVGIDARPLAEPITGIGRYTIEITKNLLHRPGKFFLYSPHPMISIQCDKDNIVLRSASKNSRFSRMLWSQSELPYQAAQDRPDVFWGSAHRLPFFLPNSIARVITIHDLVWKLAGETMRPLSRLLEKTLMPAAIRSADRIITVSQSTAQAIEEEYPAARNRIRVVYPGKTNFSTPEDFHSLTKLGVNKPYFLFVSTLEPRKNLRRLLSAYATLNESIRNRYLVVIAGAKGWGRIDVDAMKQEMRLTNQVVTVGYVNEVELATLYAHAQFLAMPSLYEGFGLPLVEAMSFGLPVLTSHCSSMPEVAADAGIFVDPLSEKSIAGGLALLLTDKTCQNKLAAMAKKNAARFSWQTAAQETWEIFEEAIAERNARKGRSS